MAWYLVKHGDFTLPNRINILFFSKILPIFNLPTQVHPLRVSWVHICILKPKFDFVENILVFVLIVNLKISNTEWLHWHDDHPKLTKIVISSDTDTLQ
jgi:hypothetical protein